MVNKRAYLRTLEAIIAIVIILFATYTLTPKEIANPRATPYIIESAQNYVITQVTDNSTLRDMIINYDSNLDLAENSLNGIAQSRTPAGYAYSTAICMNTSCVSLPELETSIYMADTLIAGQTSDDPPKSVIRVVRVWFWRLA